MSYTPAEASCRKAPPTDASSDKVMTTPQEKKDFPSPAGSLASLMNSFALFNEDTTRACLAVGEICSKVRFFRNFLG
mgnify:CR=1 FL=1